jgi:hypothetical protein
MLAAVRRVKDFSASPAETGWVLMELIANRKKWREIAKKVADNPADEDYESTIWKPRMVLQVEVDRMANTCRIKAIKG